MPFGSIGNFSPWSGSGFDTMGGFNQWVALTQDMNAPPVSETVKPKDASERPGIFYYGSQNIDYFAGGFAPAPPSSPQLFWEMMKHPAIVLAYTTTISCVIAGSRSMEIVDDKDNPKLAEEMIAAAKTDLLPALDRALPGGCMCLHFGSWLQEVVWVTRNGRVVPDYVLSVLPTEAQLFCNGQRQFTGFQIGTDFRDKRYGFLTVNQPHIHPVLGFSRNENVKLDWWRMVNSNIMGDKSERKASGIQMMIGVPGNSFVDDKGNPLMAQDVVNQIATNASMGGISTYPLTPFLKKDIINKPELANIPAIKFDTFNWGDMGSIIQAQLARMERGDQNIMRGWCRPERSAMQGHSGTGTNAESETHLDVAIVDSEQFHKTTVQQWDEQVLETWRVTNYGPDSPIIKTVALPMSDPLTAFRQAVLEGLIRDRTTGPFVQANIDERRLIEDTGLPIVSEEEAEQELIKLQSFAPGANPPLPGSTPAASGKPNGQNGQAVNGQSVDPNSNAPQPGQSASASRLQRLFGAAKNNGKSTGNS